MTYHLNVKFAERKHTYCLAAVQIQQVHGASLTLEQFLRLGHDLRDKTLKIVLLLEYIPRQIEEYLIASIFLHGQLEQLRVLYADAAECEVSAIIDAVVKLDTRLY